MRNLAETVAEVAKNGSDIDRERIEGQIKRSHWELQEDGLKHPAKSMVESMLTLANKGDEDRQFVSRLARGLAMNIAAQFGEKTFRKAQSDYGPQTSDVKAIRKFGSLVRWALKRTGSDVSTIASITMDSVKAQLSSR